MDLNLQKLPLGLFFILLAFYSGYMYTIYMKQSEMPDWVLRYKTKGHTIKKLANGYALYTCTSEYRPGKKPRSIQHFVGMITESEGLIPKKTKSPPVTGQQPLEFGLSYFIRLNFTHELKASMFNTTSSRFAKYELLLGTVLFIFGDIFPFSVRLCALCQDDLEELLQIISRADKPNIRIRRIAERIGKLFKEKIPDEKDRSALMNGLRLFTLDPGASPPSSPVFPSDLKEIAERNGLKL